MGLPRQKLAAAYQSACRAEIEALKPGNVHVFADGHRMSAQQFLDSAQASSRPLTDTALPVGRRILEAVQATRETVGVNTNLGILLLSAPLVAAAEADGDLRENLGKVLRAMTMDDAGAVFAAIVLASPGGLGSAETHDVREAPAVPLLEAMREASQRDMIARQYVTDFADVFGTGLDAYEAAVARGETDMWPVVAAYMAFLTAFPDSHVARKHGIAIADAVRQQASAVKTRLDQTAGEEARISQLLAFDAELKARHINPGTSADLTVACLLVHSLRSELACG
ncbi:triphosphoribosyl-dephospho-CoA synthase [Mesorhizobium albiziae]|uniref:Triphosphoribosyl-dephospho-CoA synthase n=1 Tax=Neomesorhizobium albiziae TaxID=335020 RepID=A0A1I3VK84_9HYPH|nr:triphosphoribosyl-dephospho-CoA synthase [Mesorhizobium albiziae]GLS28989.1 triphosphoribosyl-dephospho-CoA synthase [Mesorhizobium albiziae]SFJ95675.1 triphosphoribosyl-dephospho-CoA synthase [Mesorhizobium albiziae]